MCVLELCLERLLPLPAQLELGRRVRRLVCLLRCLGLRRAELGAELSDDFRLVLAACTALQLLDLRRCLGVLLLERAPLLDGLGELLLQFRDLPVLLHLRVLPLCTLLVAPRALLLTLRHKFRILRLGSRELSFQGGELALERGDLRARLARRERLGLVLGCALVRQRRVR